MPITPDLTIRETAALSGVSRNLIEKAVEARIMDALSASARFRGGATRYLPIRAVAYFHALQSARLTDLPLRHKRSIWRCMARLEPMKLETIEFAPGALLDLERLAANSLGFAERYRDARDRCITSNEDILGGTPVIAGTRITVYAVLGRLQDGETVEELMNDYPGVPREAFEAAEIYAKAHPLRGRPSGRGWKNDA